MGRGDSRPRRLAALVRIKLGPARTDGVGVSWLLAISDPGLPTVLTVAGVGGTVLLGLTAAVARGCDRRQRLDLIITDARRLLAEERSRRS